MSCPLCIKGSCTGLCNDEKSSKKDKKGKKKKDKLGKGKKGKSLFKAVR